MRHLNRVELIGNLGKDPEVRTMQDGKPVANLSVATSEKWRDEAGNRQERTEWHHVVVFGQVAEFAQKYMRKGNLVFVAGVLRTRTWTDQNKVERRATEIVVSHPSHELTSLERAPQGVES